MSAGLDHSLDAASAPVSETGESRPAESGGAIEVCPFLRSHDGGWSSTHSSRDLRCWAVHPAALPAISKQRQTCLVRAHADCATFVAASAPDGRLPAAAAERDTAGLWPDTRPVPVSLDPVHGRPVAGFAAPRSGGQALLVVLMVLAFLVVVLARTAGPSASGTVPGGSGTASLPAVVASPGGSDAASRPTASVPAAPSAAASPSPVATAGPSASPVPSASPLASAQTYRVRSGDTLSSIAAKYATTVKALAAANGIADVRTIHVGQVLVIP